MSAPAPELSLAADVAVRDYMAVRAGENVLITSDTAGDRAVAEAMFVAAQCAGARAVLLVSPQLPFQGRLADPYVTPLLAGAVMACDVWIDLTFPYLAGSHVYDEALKTNRVRYMLGGDMTADGLVRLFGRVDLDRYYAVHRAFDELMNAATGRAVRISNTQGTDVTFRLGPRAFEKPRRADKPGLYIVPGSCTMFPEVESVRGTICVGSIFHEYYTPLAEPMTLEVDGRIRAVKGGGNERKVADRALRRAGGGDYGYVIHFTHGIHPAARVTGRSFIEDMRGIGNDAVGLGLPFWVPGGGENHPDAVLTMQSIDLDGQRIVEDGTIVSPPELARLADALTPTWGARS
jgi:leucyl aminopeptidase (aminopeptidase T)